MPVALRQCGLLDYATAYAQMRAFTDARTAQTPDEIWLCQHPPVYTQGQAGRPGHILSANAIPVIQTDRGGQVTYHGPGQIVAYPLLDLKRLRIGVREYVCRIEQAVIDTLAEWNIEGARKDGAPGVYVAGAKIAALGIRVRRGRAFHGLAFNIAGESVAPFGRINPCGYEGLRVVALSDLGGPSALEAVKPVLLDRLAAQFGLAMESGPSPDLAAFDHPSPRMRGEGRARGEFQALPPAIAPGRPAFPLDICAGLAAQYEA